MAMRRVADVGAIGKNLDALELSKHLGAGLCRHLALHHPAFD
jgi:hypothetical protein